MQVSHENLLIGARRAYEFGRLRSALPVLLKVLPLVVISALACGDLRISCALGVLLATASVYFLWKGQKFGEGVQTGLLIGSAAFALPVFAELTGKCCALGSHAILCASIGIMAGAAVGLHILRSRETEARYLISVTAITILTGSLGCALLGLGGTVGLFIGVLIPTTPLYLLARARAH